MPSDGGDGHPRRDRLPRQRGLPASRPQPDAAAQRAWAAWNVMQGEDPAADLCVTYWMNALQGIDPARPLFVTLNPPSAPDPDAHLRALHLRPSAIHRGGHRRPEAPARDPGPQPHLVLRRLDAARLPRGRPRLRASRSPRPSAAPSHGGRPKTSLAEAAE